MTETLQDPVPPSEQPAPPPHPPPRLVRSPDDKVVAGVCAAIGRSTGTDPVLWRVLLAALVLFGGAGIALYGLGWLLIPLAGEPRSLLERQLRRPDRSINAAGIVLLIVLAVVLSAVTDDGAGLLVLLVVAALAYLVVRERRAGAGTGSPLPTWVPSGAPSSYGVPPVPPGEPPFGPGQYGPAQYGPAQYAPPVFAPPPPRQPRPRSVLGPITLCSAALVSGALLLARELGADGITAARVLAAALLVVGAGLLVGTWYGRARWLLAVGLVLGFVLLPVAAVGDRLDGGAGERTWRPSGPAVALDYRLGVGEATLDLTEVEPGSIERIRAEIGIGSLIVLVPADLRVRVETEVGVGEVREVFGRFGDEELRGDTAVLDLGPAGSQRLQLDVEVGLGEIEVRRVAA